MENSQPKKLEETIGNAKLITISTIRFENPNYDGRLFPERLNYKAHISKIEFSNPITIPKGDINYRVTLRTAWFREAFGQDPYWKQELDDKRGYSIIHSDNFEQLRGDFQDYSKSKLESWQRSALKRHKAVLDKIEELYYSSGDGILIQKDLFSS